MKHLKQLDYLLLQVRRQDDPVRDQEIACFARTLQADVSQFRICDLLTRAPTVKEIKRVDVLLLGGSGHYSAIGKEKWLQRALGVLREIHGLAKPTFSSCWGFQAMARAMGGTVVHDLSRAELGTIDLKLTLSGKRDSVFGFLRTGFRAQAGHEDLVEKLPLGTTLLASSDRVQNQAYCFDRIPIYCTQFHPEINRNDLIGRLHSYPEYVERIASVSFEVFLDRCGETALAESLLIRFIEHVFSD